jgi:hypothetical protein
MRSFKAKLLSFVSIICILSCLFTINASALAEGTVFDAILSGDEYAIIGEKYVLNLTVGNFTEEEFLGVTCDIDYDKDVFEIDNAYLEIINGSGIDAETYPLINAEDGWIFIGANREGTFTVTILNDSDLKSLEGDSVSCFIEFKVKENAKIGESIIKIDTDDGLLGTFSETLIESKLGTGSQINVNICDEVPKYDSIIIKSESSVVRKTAEIVDIEIFTGFREVVTVSDFKKNFKNLASDLRITHNNIVLDPDDLVPSGSYIELLDGETVIDSVLIILKGDVNGSGSVNASDYLEIKKYFKSEFYVLEDWSLIAADIDSNGVISSTDYLLLKSYFNGTLDIY